jgi:hypothetical protein
MSRKFGICKSNKLISKNRLKKKNGIHDSILKFKGTYKDIVPIGVHRFITKKVNSIGLFYDSQVQS